MQRTMLRWAGLAVLPLALGGCPAAPIQPVLTLPSLQGALGPAWTMVPLPNTKLSPGAIVQINPVDAPTLAAAKSLDVVWLGTLADCSVPDTAVDVTPGPVPGIATGSNYAFNADLGAKLAGVSLDASANVKNTAQIKIDESSDSSLDYIKFSNWVADPANAKGFDTACGALLSRPSVYVVQEAFIISKGSYSLDRSGGGKIAVTPPPNVPVTAAVDASGGQTGDLTITAPVVFALKTMQALPQGGFQVASVPHPAHHFALHPLLAHAPQPVMAASPPPPASPLAGKALITLHLPGF